jgi:hypothetical protein
MCKVLLLGVLHFGKTCQKKNNFKRSSLFCWNREEKSFLTWAPCRNKLERKRVCSNNKPWGRYYKTFYGSNFCRIVIG